MVELDRAADGRPSRRPRGYRSTARSDGRGRARSVALPAARLVLPAGTRRARRRGIDAQRGEDWARPVADGGRASPLFVYSLLLATFLGTMGLPHILVRFYTNPRRPGGAADDRARARAARGLLPVPGGLRALGRALVARALRDGRDRLVVLRLPEAALARAGRRAPGRAWSRPGAFAAFMSTASGLLVSLAGTPSFDLWRAAHRPRPAPGVGADRASAGGRAAMVLPAALALLARAPRHLRPRGLGLRAGREHVLPAAAAGDLVEAADGARHRVGMVAGAASATGGIVAALVAGSAATTRARPTGRLLGPAGLPAMIGVSLAGRPIPGVAGPHARPPRPRGPGAGTSPDQGRLTGVASRSRTGEAMSTRTSGAPHDLSGDELALVLDAACAVLFHLDVASGEVRWAGSPAALTGAGEAPATFEAFLECVHPDDRAGLHAAVAATPPDGATATRGLRVVWPDGSAHWLDARWRLVVDGAGGTIVGIARQIDAERAALERTQFLADVSAALDASLDYDATLATVADLARAPPRRLVLDRHGRRRPGGCATSPSRTSTPPRSRSPTACASATRPTSTRRRAPRTSAAHGRVRALRRASAEEQLAAGRRRRAPRARALARPELGDDRPPARARPRARRDHPRRYARARRTTGRGRLAFAEQIAARAALAVDNARLYREAREQQRALRRGPRAARRARRPGPDRPRLPRRRAPLRARQRPLAEINGVPAADHVGRPSGEVLPATRAPTSRPRSSRCSPPASARRLHVVGETPRAPGREPPPPRQLLPRARSRAGSAWASASPWPT